MFLPTSVDDSIKKINNKKICAAIYLYIIV